MYEWLAATNHALLVATCCGWLSWLVAPNSPNPLTWGSITVCADQGGDGWSALHFLLFKRVNLLVVADPSHRCWNDMQLALQDAGAYHICMFTCILLNLDGGPWEGQRWWQELRQGAAEYAQVSSETCKVFSSMIMHLRQDKSLDPAAREEDFTEKSLFHGLKDSVEHKFQKVYVTRWFQYAVACRLFLQMWTCRFIIVLYVCISMGYFDKGGIADALRLPSSAVADANAGEEIDKSTTAKDRDKNPESQATM